MSESTNTRIFASLSVPNYRYFFCGALISNVGTWMQNVARGWLVLTILTNNSATALGLVTALTFLATPFLTPFAGVFADRFPKRNVLLVTQSAMALLAGGLWLLVFTNVVQLWMVFCFAFTQGVIQCFDKPARQSFVSEIVADDLLANAVSLNSTSFNSARMIGPAVSGLLIGAFGVAPALGINALSYLAMIAALAAMKPALLHTPPQRQIGGATSEGFRYLKTRPDIIMILVMVFMLSTFGLNFQINNATMATQVFGKGAEQYGLLGTMMAVGTLSGALLNAKRGNPKLSVLMIGLSGFAVFELILGMSPNYWFYGVLLMAVGFCQLTVLNTANSFVQLSTPPQLRGRVMGIYVAVMNGGTPVGATLIGWVNDAWGPRWGILLGGIAVGLTCIGCLAYLVRARGLHASINRRWPPSVSIRTSSQVVTDPESESTRH
jgi:MFS family permease